MKSDKYPLDVLPVYTPRFVTPEQLNELINLYHLAKVALSGNNPSKYNRMIWASNAFHNEHPEISSTAAYKDLSAQLEGW